MPEDTIRTIRGLLSSAEASDLRRGLELARTEIARAGPVAARPLFEMISALFYIDPLDRPDLLPVLDDAVNLVVGLGAWVIPALVEKLDSGDLKAQMAAGHALGRIGADAIDPLLGEYGEREDTDRRCFILYALGKIKSPDVLRALPIAIAAAGSPDLELRDTAVRAIGKFAESIPEGGVDAALSRRLVELLEARLADTNAGVRAKATRSLGKLARFGHLPAADRERIGAVCRRLVGADESFEWDRAFIVRKEAEEALRYF